MYLEICMLSYAQFLKKDLKLFLLRIELFCNLVIKAPGAPVGDECRGGSREGGRSWAGRAEPPRAAPLGAKVQPAAPPRKTPEPDTEPPRHCHSGLAFSF